MNCQYNLLLLFLCGFAALSVSTEECGKDLLVGTSCIIKRTSSNKEKPPEIKWVHNRNGDILRWKGGKVRGTYAGASMEEDGSLKMSKVSLNDTGKYKFYEFNADGAEIGTREVEIKVYEKAPKPTVRIKCTKDGNATLSCDIGNREDLTVSWYKDKMIQNDKKTQVLLSFTQVQENKPYSCEAQNPVSKEKSESTAISCSGPGSGFGKLFGFDFWVMLGILAGGGALLLLLICVLIICACRSCRQRKKRQQDEEELRLEGLTPGQNGTSRSKQTARGQPAPPVPQEDSILCSPSPETPRSQTQPKAQIRARPPPPPQDEEDPPPLPQPRNKQHRNKRSQEPYRPME